MRRKTGGILITSSRQLSITGLHVISDALSWLEDQLREKTEIRSIHCARIGDEDDPVEEAPVVILVVVRPDVALEKDITGRNLMVGPSRPHQQYRGSTIK